VLSWKPPQYYENHQKRGLAEPSFSLSPGSGYETDFSDSDSTGIETDTESSLEALTGAIGGAFSLLHAEELE
jgi:hypothetical protein